MFGAAADARRCRRARPAPRAARRYLGMRSAARDRARSPPERRVRAGSHQARSLARPRREAPGAGLEGCGRARPRPAADALGPPFAAALDPRARPGLPLWLDTLSRPDSLIGHSQETYPPALRPSWGRDHSLPIAAARRVVALSRTEPPRPPCQSERARWARPLRCVRIRAPPGGSQQVLRQRARRALIARATPARIASRRCAPCRSRGPRHDSA